MLNEVYYRFYHYTTSEKHKNLKFLKNKYGGQLPPTSSLLWCETETIFTNPIIKFLALRIINGDIR